MSPAHLCLIRHGETDWNRARRIQGHLDMPLNHTGLEQAARLARPLVTEGFDAIYSSDLLRARQTAAPTSQALNLPVVSMESLRERQFGDFQGLTYDEARERYPQAHVIFTLREPEAEVPGGGESLRMFFARIAQALETIARHHAGQRVMVVTHGGVLDMAHRLASELPLKQRRNFEIGNATLNWLVFDNRGWRIESWDQRSHLDQVLDELPG